MRPLSTAAQDPGSGNNKTGHINTDVVFYDYYFDLK